MGHRVSKRSSHHLYQGEKRCWAALRVNAFALAGVCSATHDMLRTMALGDVVKTHVGMVCDVTNGTILQWTYILFLRVAKWSVLLIVFVTGAARLFWLMGFATAGGIGVSQLVRQSSFSGCVTRVVVNGNNCVVLCVKVICEQVLGIAS